MADDGGPRFSFGKNWRSYAKLIDDDRIAGAVASLRDMLGVETLAGKRFLDIGSGSGLFSLAAHRLGADVTSFDYDVDAVACTNEVKARFAAPDARWKVLQGSVLDAPFLASLGTFDVVYSWGVLHHTGAMWDAIDLARARVAPGGMLFIAIYNDQKLRSNLRTAVKRTYVSGPVGQAAMIATFVPYFALEAAAQRVLMPSRAAKRARGMAAFHDWIDWIGGYPFEVATPEAIVDRTVPDGFVLTKLRTLGSSLGCNEYVFRRTTGAARPA